MENQKIKLPGSDRIKIICPQCHSRLCDRMKTDNGWVIHFKKGRSQIFTTWGVLICNCGSKYRIDANKGIVESYQNKYNGSRVQIQNTTAPDSR